MNLLERILVPTDFSPAAEGAVRMAVFVAKQLDSKISLLHVMPTTVNVHANVRAIFVDKIGGHLKQIAEQIRAEGIPSVDTVVEEGVPFEHIDLHATQRDVNVIIMAAGTSGDGGSVRLGNTTARIRRKAAKPVWIVPPGSSPQVNKILCPVDGSKSSGRALKNAIHLARRFPAELTVLMVVQGLPDCYDRFGQVAVMAEQASAREQLPQFEQFLAEFDLQDVTWNKTIRYGKPYQEILNAARETHSDLLVMGSVGKTGFSRILVGGVARRVAQEIPCSIVTVKSENAIRLRLDAEIAGIEANLKQGFELLEHGFPEEALDQFQQCSAKDMMYAPAWEGLAASYRRLAHGEKAESCTKRAESIVRHLWDKQVEADIRSRHPLVGRKNYFY